MALKIFVDFDGTITHHDVGNVFFREFGGESCTVAVQEYREGKISAKECFRREVDAIGTINKADVERFVRRQPIDGSFKSFVDFCGENGIELAVVSDGLDYYIQEIFDENGIQGVSVFANLLLLHPTEKENEFRLDIQFPYDDAECTRCACSKKNIMLTRSGEDDILVYVGEGYSDRCPVQYADIVFAKDELQTFCQQENISYYLYSSFADVVARLETIMVKKTIRKRLRAEQKRREAFVCE